MELKGEKISTTRLLEMIDQVKYSYDLYIILKRIPTIFDTEISLLIEKIEKKLKDFINLQEMIYETNNDKFLIPLIFNILKKLCFKSKEKKTRKSNSYEIINKEKNLNLMKSILDTTYLILTCQNSNQETIFSALNYIYKHIENPVGNFVIEGNIKINVSNIN